MNLGGLLGEQKLRIMQLEDEFDRRNIHIVATDTSAPPAPTGEEEPATRINESTSRARRGYNRGIRARVHAALPDHPPGVTLAELAERLPDVHRPSISAFLIQFRDVEHTGERFHYRYYRKAAA